MLMLGFADDVLDIRWSAKISLSFVASLPILIAYNGLTAVVIPKPLDYLFGFSVIDLGLFSKI
jgi:hypothetical protein